MGKQKRKKKVKKLAPPLSKLDTFTYHFLLIASVVLFILLLLLYFYITRKIAFVDNSVIFYAERWTQILIAPAYTALCISVIGFFGDGLNNRKVIFGNKDIKYNSTTRYSSAQFLFKKNKRKKENLNDNEKKFEKIVTISLIIFCSLSLVLGIGGMFGRKCLYNNGHIKIFSITNSVKTEYSLDDLSHITIQSGTQRRGRYNWQDTCFITITTKDNKNIVFCMDENNLNKKEIEQKLSDMLYIKEYYESHGFYVSIEENGRLDKIIESYDMNDTEKAMLYELFELK